MPRFRDWADTFRDVSFSIDNSIPLYFALKEVALEMVCLSESYRELNFRDERDERLMCFAVSFIFPYLNLNNILKQKRQHSIQAHVENERTEYIFASAK